MPKKETGKMNNLYELVPYYTNQKSFGRKAMVKVSTDSKELWSYDTLVAEISEGIAHVYNLQSQTTIKHVKEFLLQNDFKATTKKQIQTNYMEV